MAGRKKRDGPLNYFELPRKQLQSLCKKYGFPANKTNLLMAEFLTAHLNVSTCLPLQSYREDLWFSLHACMIEGKHGGII